jgi:phage tail P2-like protein
MTFQSILPASSGLFEKALEEVFGTSLDAIEPELIKTFWDPDRIPAAHLSVLAHALSVDLWDESWSELKKRSVVRRWVQLEFSKGTYSGYRDFVEIAGGELRQVVLPPGGYFASAELTKAEWDDWADQHPRIRIQLAKRTGSWNRPEGIFAGHSFAGYEFLGIDDGPALHGRRATYRRNAHAEDEDIQVVRIERDVTTRQATVHERVILPRPEPNSFMAGFSFVGHAFAGAFDIDQRSYSYALSASYRHTESRLWLDTVPPGFEPRDTRYYRVSDIGDAGRDIHAGFSFCGNGFATHDRASEMLADVLYLHDPDIAAPMVRGTSFAGRSRVGSARFQAELRIRANGTARRGEAFGGEMYAGWSFTRSEDPTRRKAMYAALRAAKSARDRLLVTFQNVRPRTLGDGLILGDGVALSDRVPFTL